VTRFLDNFSIVLCTNVRSWHDLDRTCALYNAYFFMFWVELQEKKLEKLKEVTLGLRVFGEDSPGSEKICKHLCE